MDALLNFLLNDKVFPILTAIAGWTIATVFARRQRSQERQEDAVSHRKTERKRDDFEHYKILISMYQKFLVMTIPHIDLQIHPDQDDLSLVKGTKEFSQRRVFYEYLFYMFEKAYMLKAAMEDPERLGNSLENRWTGWEIWIESYLKKKSVREEFNSVSDYGLDAHFQNWVKAKISALPSANS